MVLRPSYTPELAVTPWRYSIILASVLLGAAPGCGVSLPAPTRDCGLGDERSACGPPVCEPGTSAACACTDGRSGTQLCANSRMFEACICAPGDAGPVDAARGDDAALCDIDEWCNALDDDCDGAIDEGFPCPDDTVTGTVAASARISATLSVSGTGEQFLREFVPGVALAIDLNAYPGPIRPIFAPDGSLYYSEGSTTIRHWVAGVLTTLALAPCARVSGFSIAMDGAVTTQCAGGDVIRGGIVVVPHLGSLLGVLPGGEIVTESFTSATATTGPVVSIHDSAGNEMGSYSFEGWLGQFQPVTSFGTPAPDGSAYFGLVRQYLGTRREIVVFRVAPSAAFTIVRRLLLPVRFDEVEVTRNFAPLPDGRIVEHRVQGSSLTSATDYLDIWEVDGSVTTLFSSMRGVDAEALGSYTRLAVTTW